MTRRPGRSTGAPLGTGERSSAEGTALGRLDEPELLAEAGRVLAPLLAAARREHGRIIGVTEPEWWHSTDRTKLGGLATLALGWLLHDPERAVRRRLREMAWDLAASADWAVVARRHVSHGDLGRRRARPGPMARPVDFEAAARWATTGRGDGGAAAS